jgi:SAM-dependent methyltransferase
MGLRKLIRAAAQALRRLPVISPLLDLRAVRFRLQRFPGADLLYGRGWELLHPYDYENGVDTSGYVPPEGLPKSTFSQEMRACYGGSQPSIIRAALETIPALEAFTFVDLGCGKGRPLLVASEFPFLRIIGVELSVPLAQAAERNVEVMRRRFPGRHPLQIVNRDAAAFVFPAGDLVIFLYNPFGAEVIQQVIVNLEAALAASNCSLFVVYYNPVFGAYFDGCRGLKRYFAKTIPYAPDERGFGPDTADPVVIWQGGASLPPLPGAGARIDIVRPDNRAELAS